MSEPIQDDPPLTDQQQQMMAYVDDELSPEERSAFERTMAGEPELAKEAVKLKNLMDLSRSMALSEPTDHELRRFWARFYNRTEWRLGWVLLSGGLIVLAAEGLYLLVTSAWLTWTQKAALLSAVVGGLLLGWNTVRLKLRTSHFDRYRGVMR